MTPWLALSLAVLPGLFAAWRGRRLASHPDETLAERFFAHRRTVAGVAGSVATLLVLTAGVHVSWALPLLVLALLRGSYPVRRAVLGESWGFAAYASHMLRFGTAAVGFYTLLAATPALVAALGPASALPLAAVLLAWASGSRHVFLALVRARPLERPDLLPQLNRVLGASAIPRPTLHRAGPRGGRMVNAFALPALPESSVLFTDGLLEAFSADEIGAVFAHEVSHLEHFGRSRLWRRGFALLALTGLAAFAVPRAAALVPTLGDWLPRIWALAVAIAVPLVLAAHRGHEAESDRRAVELCGDADALVRALVKLHSLSALPRRFSLDVERGSSHPSLARRIQAIRGAGGAEPVQLPAPVVLQAEEPGRFVVLESERAHWLEGADPALAATPEALRLGAARVESLAYAQLAELHLDAGPRGVVLAARTVSGRKTRLRLRADAAAAAQAALDVVDARLAPAPVAGTVPALLGTLTATCLVFAALLGGHPFMVGPPALVALWRTGPAPLAVAGATAVAAAAARSVSPGTLAPSPLSLALMALAGLVSLLAAFALWKSAPDTRGRGRRAALAVQSAASVVAVLGLAATALFGASLLRLHQATAASAAGPVLLGLAVALAFSERSRGRVLVVVPLAAALLVALVGSAPFRRQYVSDPLLADASPLRVTTATPAPLVAHELGEFETDTRLSPSGRSFAARVWDEGAEEEGAAQFRVRTQGGDTIRIAAFDLCFVDDERVLLLTLGDRGRVEVALARLLAPTAPEWRVDAGTLASPELRVDLATRRWQLAGVDRPGRIARVAAGALAGGPIDEVRFALPQTPVSQVLVGPRGGLALRPQLSPAGETALLPLVPFLVQSGAGLPLDTEIVRLTAEGPQGVGTTRLALHCVAAGEEPTCLADAGEHTTVWQTEAGTAGLVARASLPGRLTPVQAQADTIVAFDSRMEPVVLRVRDRELVRLRGAGRFLPVLAPGGRALGLVSHEGARPALRVYALP